MKELFLLRGLPGSGKSTLANSLFGTHVEADMYFLDPQGEYKFDASKLKHAHQWCQDTVEATMNYNSYPEVIKLTNGSNRIIVSNTFTQEWEMQPYFDLAEKYGYRVYSLIVENRHGVSEDTNIHNVPKDAIQKMRDRFEIKL